MTIKCTSEGHIWVNRYSWECVTCWQKASSSGFSGLDGIGTNLFLSCVYGLVLSVAQVQALITAPELKPSATGLLLSCTTTLLFQGKSYTLLSTLASYSVEQGLQICLVSVLNNLYVFSQDAGSYFTFMWIGKKSLLTFSSEKEFCSNVLILIGNFTSPLTCLLKQSVIRRYL